MQYITGTKEFNFKNTVVTLGKFDGLHKGHRKLLETLGVYKKEGYTTIVFSFNVAPKKLISGEDTRYILTKEEKRIFNEKCGVDVFIEYPFDHETSKLGAEEFVYNVLLKQLDVKKIVCGIDFKFGHNRKGDINLLEKLGEKYGFQVIAIKKEQFSHKDISSTVIREELLKGNIEIINEMLGYPYTLIGEVVHGKQLGRTLGSPTLNIIPPKSKLLPPNGVYFTKTIVDGKVYNGITNIGFKPTVSDESAIGVETHLFDFEGDLYGERLEIKFCKFVRNEKKFESVESLREQILADIKVCKDKFC